MKEVYDCCSKSYCDLIDLISQCGWMDSEERQKILIIAPFMTQVERQQIADSLMIEAGLILNNPEAEQP